MFVFNLSYRSYLYLIILCLCLQILDDKTYSHLVLCVVVTTAIVTPLIRLLYKHRPRVLNSSSIFDEEMRTIQNTPKNSEFRIVTCLHSEGNVRGMTALMEICNPIQESPLCVFVIHLIELLGKSASMLITLTQTTSCEHLKIMLITQMVL
jgi:hypothetical protein